MADPSTADSTIFRKLVQQQASTKASKIDIKSILPLGRLKNWLLASASLVVLTLGLFQIPEFGSDLKLLMQRAMMPGANLPLSLAFKFGFWHLMRMLPALQLMNLYVLLP